MRYDSITIITLLLLVLTNIVFVKQNRFFISELLLNEKFTSPTNNFYFAINTLCLIS